MAFQGYGNGVGLDRRKIFNEVSVERHEQDKEWGGPDHDDEHSSHDWIAFIVKQLGKAAAVATKQKWNSALFRAAMIKVAALAIAAIEWADREIDID